MGWCGTLCHQMNQERWHQLPGKGEGCSGGAVWDGRRTEGSCVMRTWHSVHTVVVLEVLLETWPVVFSSEPNTNRTDPQAIYSFLAQPSCKAS